MPWPATLPEQFAAVRAALEEMGEATPDQIARRFVRGASGRVQARTIAPLMDTLSDFGHAERGADGRFAA
jgi:hypothetical protein